MSSVLDAAQRAAYIVAKHEKVGDEGHIGMFGGKKIKQEINQMAAEKLKATLATGTQGVTKLINKAIGLLNDHKITISNAMEFKASVDKAREMLGTPQGKEIMQRISFVQKLQSDVSELKSKMTALRGKIDGNDHLKAAFSKRLVAIENDVIGGSGNHPDKPIEQNLNDIYKILMTNKGQLAEQNARATSQGNINAIKHNLEIFSRDFQALEQECSKRMGNIERRAQQVQTNPLVALQEATLYLDRSDTALADEAYKAHPGLVAENIIAAGTVLLNKALNQENYRDLNEDKALYKLIECFSLYGILGEFETAKGRKEFLGKLKQYCQKRASSIEPKISTAETETAGLQNQIKSIDDAIEKERSTLGNQVLGFIGMGPSDKLTDLEKRRKALQTQIANIREETAISIAGKNTHGVPKCAFKTLKDQLKKFKDAETKIEQALSAKHNP